MNYAPALEYSRQKPRVRSQSQQVQIDPPRAPQISFGTLLRKRLGYRTPADVETKNDLKTLARSAGFLRKALISYAFGDSVSQRYAELRDLSEDDGGAPLNPKAEAELLSIARARVPLPRSPHLFLTDTGGMTLSWDESSRNSKVLIIEPTETIYLDRKSGITRSFRHGDHKSLEETLKLCDGLNGQRVE